MLKRKTAVSKCVTILIVIGVILIVLTSVFLGVYFTILQKNEDTQQKPSFAIQLIGNNIADTNKDSVFDYLTFMLINNYSSVLTLYNYTIWVSEFENLNDANTWIDHKDWYLQSLDNLTINPLQTKEVTLIAGDQISLTVSKEHYCRISFYNATNEGYNQIISNWFSLNEIALLDDLVFGYESLDLLAEGLDCSMYVPGLGSNYYTVGGGEFGPLIEEAIISLPVINESEFVPFYYAGQFVVFHSLIDNLTSQPVFQQINKNLRTT